MYATGQAMITLVGFTWGVVHCARCDHTQIDVSENDRRGVDLDVACERCNGPCRWLWRLGSGCTKTEAIALADEWRRRGLTQQVEERCKG